MKITPVLVVPSIESVLPLYDALGFERKVEVPHGDAIGSSHSNMAMRS